MRNGAVLGNRTRLRWIGSGKDGFWANFIWTGEAIGSGGFATPRLKAHRCEKCRLIVAEY